VSFPFFSYSLALTIACSLYVYSISVALQALMVISVGGLADKGGHPYNSLI
jgi:MFS-type transporter involved in bile tolerance (Atg22 family)